MVRITAFDDNGVYKVDFEILSLMNVRYAITL